MRGVKNGPSPKWLQQRLLAIGLRPINALVDITNYITFDRGRPLHVFDAKKVAGNLTVRRARDGEKVLALDGREYTLTPEMCVIADENGVESIAGVMGGEHSGCDENTTDVLIESALWEPLNVARTGRTLGIITDARYRFERGVDPEFMVPGARACHPHGDRVLRRQTERHRSRRLCRPHAENRVLPGVGSEAPDRPRRAEGRKPRHLAPPRFHAAGRCAKWSMSRCRPGGRMSTARPTSSRKSCASMASTRSRHGRWPATTAVNGKILTTLQVRTRAAKRALASRGMMEAVTWSFIPAKHAEIFGGGQTALKLANPIAADMSDMRPSLLPGLLAAAQRNADRGFADVALFEVSGAYAGDSPDTQRRVAAGVRRGTATLDGSGRAWSGNAKPVGVFDARADAIAVLEACGAPVDRLQVEAGGPAWYHPGRSGTIKLGPKVVLGTFGEFHPKTLEALDVDGPLCGFEVFVDAIPESKAKPTRTKPKLELSAFQAVKRDFAFVVDRAVEAGSLSKAALAADKKLITGVNVFDVFEGAALGPDKKSIAIEVSIQPVEKTLTDEDFEALAKRIVENVGKQTGGVLRG